ncbi:hypothetical protein [Barrientosiimonas humi]|uniref:hypothetical protein n=1 Tax=Barrientosiimonas humi TaxID=999931 RepID=UPI00370D8379
MIVGAGVKVGAVDEQAQRGVEVLAGPLVLVVLVGEAPFDVSEAGADAVLVTLEGLQVDGVGEVRGEEFVALVLESLAVRGEFGQFLGARGEAFLERGFNLCREVGVLLFGDGDVLVAV